MRLQLMDLEIITSMRVSGSSKMGALIMKNTSFRELIHQRFDTECVDRMTQDTQMFIIAMAEEDSREEELAAFLHENQTATLQDTLDYITAHLTEPLEIVDDDELDEDDWED